MTTSRIPSAQVNADGQPRFHLPAPTATDGWADAVAEEADGGVAADIRIFLDAQLGEGDVLTCPAGEAGAHQVRNDTDHPVRVMIFLISPI